MRARVDSKEFSVAMNQAMKWTTSSAGVGVGKMVRLRVVEGYLLIRTTVLDGDSVLAVNAFDIEHGDVITMASYLREFSWSVDGWLVIECDNGKLTLNYKDFASPEVSTIDSADFPSMLTIPYQVNLTKEILLRAAAHTQPMAKTGFPIKSCVHIIPATGGVAIVGSDGVIGYMKTVEGVELDKYISIEANTLSAALGGVGDIVRVGTTRGRVEVAARDAPSRIQFSGVSSPDPDKMTEFFALETKGEPLEVDGQLMKKVQFLASKAAAIDPAAEMLVYGDGVVTGKILGRDITIPEFEICSGSALPIVFRCDSFSRSLSILTDTEKYRVSVHVHSDNAHLWFIDGDGRHSVMSSAPVRFKETLQLLQGRE